MKSIILFRHAKADWNPDYINDHERPLNSTGMKAAKKMGQYLSDINIIPDLVISSSALRTKTTSSLAIKEGQWDSIFKIDSNIYGGDTEFLLNLFKKQSNKNNLICLTGHEPYLSSFLGQVINRSNIIFPTASMSKINFNVSSWEEIEFNNAVLDWFIKPKELI